MMKQATCHCYKCISPVKKGGVVTPAARRRHARSHAAAACAVPCAFAFFATAHLDNPLLHLKAPAGSLSGLSGRGVARPRQDILFGDSRAHSGSMGHSIGGHTDRAGKFEALPAQVRQAPRHAAAVPLICNSRVGPCRDDRREPRLEWPPPDVLSRPLRIAGDACGVTPVAARSYQ